MGGSRESRREAQGKRGALRSQDTGPGCFMIEINFVWRRHVYGGRSDPKRGVQRVLTVSPAPGQET